MEWITNKWPVLLQIITGIIAVASLIVKLTPTPADDAFLAKIINLLGLLALNPKNNKK